MIYMPPPEECARRFVDGVADATSKDEGTRSSGPSAPAHELDAQPTKRWISWGGIKGFARRS